MVTLISDSEFEARDRKSMNFWSRIDYHLVFVEPTTHFFFELKTRAGGSAIEKLPKGAPYEGVLTSPQPTVHNEFSILGGPLKNR